MEQIDKIYSVHYTDEKGNCSLSIAESNDREKAIEGAKISLESSYTDKGDYVCTDVDMVLVTEYTETGDCSVEDIIISIDARKPDDTCRADYYASVL